MRVIGAREVEELLDFDKLLEALALAMADVSSGAASVPARIGAMVRERGALLGAMPAYVPSVAMLSAKLVTLFPGNAGGSLPTHQAVIVAFDPESGEPDAVLDGTYITAFRTAAGSALATKLLSREDSSTLSILGTGVQARFHARAIPRVRPIRQVLVAGRNESRASALAGELERDLGIPARRASNWQEAVELGDVVCATVHPREPVVQGRWLRAGVHVNSVGVAEGGEEVDSEAIRRSRVFVEQRSAAASPMPTGSNDLHRAVREGVIAMDDLTEIGEIVLGTRPGRAGSADITLYKSVGIAAQDAAAAAVVMKAARA